MSSSSLTFVAFDTFATFVKRREVLDSPAFDCSDHVPFFACQCFIFLHEWAYSACSSNNSLRYSTRRRNRRYMFLVALPLVGVQLYSLGFTAAYFHTPLETLGGFFWACVFLCSTVLFTEWFSELSPRGTRMVVMWPLQLLLLGRNRKGANSWRLTRDSVLRVCDAIRSIDLEEGASGGGSREGGKEAFELEKRGVIHALRLRVELDFPDEKRI